MNGQLSFELHEVSPELGERFRQVMVGVQEAGYRAAHESPRQPQV